MEENKAQGVKVYENMPKGWRVIKGALTAPKGYVWICNGKSIFSKEYEKGYIKEEVLYADRKSRV